MILKDIYKEKKRWKKREKVSMTVYEYERCALLRGVGAHLGRRCFWRSPGQCRPTYTRILLASPCGLDFPCDSQAPMNLQEVRLSSILYVLHIVYGDRLFDKIREIDNCYYKI